MYLLLFFAFLAGFVTVISPCILPVLPLLLSAGIGQGRLRPYGIITGLIISFTFFTLCVTALVRVTGVSPDILRYGALLVIALFGLTLLFPSLGNWVSAHAGGIARLGNWGQTASEKIGNGFWSGFVLGSALGLIWTPCAGPILASISALVATSSVTVTAVLTTLAYAIGTALPMLAIMYGGNAINTYTSSLSAHSETIRKVFGGLMIAGALSIFLHADLVLQQFAATYIPSFVIDDTSIVKNALHSLAGKSAMKLSQDPLQAPDFSNIASWINSTPLSIKELRGRVVLVDFWTYSCINCVRTLPHLKEWYSAYKDLGFVIVGIHTPEFEFEKKVSNVRDAVSRFGITYPVALDNEYKTWQSYANRYWPAHYLIDAQGIIRYTHFGEGSYSETENAIRKLLNLPPKTIANNNISLKPQTPETYLGYARAHSYPRALSITPDKEKNYKYEQQPASDEVIITGNWTVHKESITAGKFPAQLRLNFLAGRVYLVLSSPHPQKISVLLDEKPLKTDVYTSDNPDGTVVINAARMYEITTINDDQRHTLTLNVPEGVSLYAFTFGSR